MKRVLLLNSSLNGTQGKSHQLALRLAEGLSDKYDAALIHRDLATMDLPHLSQTEMAAWMCAEGERDSAQQQLASLSDGLIAELTAADILILGVPMYNFGIPSSLKAWLDRVARAGITFRYTDQGPVGLLGDKQVYITCARGGMYQGTVKDTQTPYLHDVLNFIGLREPHFVYAEGLAMAGGEGRLAAAEAEIDQLISKA